MEKQKRVIKQLLSIVMVVSLIMSLIDTNAFADTGAVFYGGNYYETIEEALQSAYEDEEYEPYIQINNELIYNDTITIKAGYSVTISAQESTNFSVNKAGVVFEIESGGTLILENINVQGNTVNNKNATNYNSNIVINKGTMELKNSQIQEFKLNKSGIVMENANLIMDEESSLTSVVQHNFGAGGIIYATGECRITGGTIEGGYAYSEGGAIKSTGTLIMSGTVMRNNSVNNFGGAIYAKNVYIMDCEFDSNYAGIGGASILATGILEIYNSKFANTVGVKIGSGGAIRTGVNTVLGGIYCEGTLSSNWVDIASGHTVFLDSEKIYDTTYFGQIKPNDNIVKSDKYRAINVQTSAEMTAIGTL